MSKSDNDLEQQYTPVKQQSERGMNEGSSSKKLIKSKKFEIDLGEEEEDKGCDFIDSQITILKHGPNENKRCTDMIFCVLFLAVLGYVGYLSYQGFKTGDPDRLGSPYDPERLQYHLPIIYPIFRQSLWPRN